MFSSAIIQAIKNTESPPKTAVTNGIPIKPALLKAAPKFLTPSFLKNK